MTESNLTLRGRHAVVTGGGRGLGAAIAATIAAHGAHVTLMGRTKATLEASAETVRASAGTRVHVVECDVTSPAAVQHAFDDAVRQLGAVHILVNNAGHADASPFGQISLESWNQTVATNLTGTLLCIQRVLPAMVAASFGRIVNVASTAGLKGYKNVAAYCAAKHGVIGLTRALALETARNGVTVNAVCPGYTEGTDMFRAAVEHVQRAAARSAEEARAMLTRPNPRGALITTQEVADTVLWLCTTGASAITGQAIAVAGGEVM
jgi:NAD(P)-dependent dehydrogenase (short-subunit alcohol dehydrogenase family)